MAKKGWTTTLPDRLSWLGSIWTFFVTIGVSGNIIAFVSAAAVGFAAWAGSFPFWVQIAVPLSISANVLLGWDYWRTRKQLAALSKRAGSAEPARRASSQWDLMPSFAIWEAAALWCGQEPVLQLPPSPSEPYMVLKRWMREGELGAFPVQYDPTLFRWERDHVTREELIRYASKHNERPRFLFPADRAQDWMAH